MAEDSTRNDEVREPGERDFIEILQILWRARWNIMKLTFGAAVIAAIISLVMPYKYETVATVLPQMDQANFSSGALANLASIAGITRKEVSLAELYPVLFVSESVLKGVLSTSIKTEKMDEPETLTEYWGIREETPLLTLEKSLKKIRSALEIEKERKTNIITVVVTTDDPEMGVEILTNLFESTEEFLRTKQTSFAREQRKWIDTRLTEVKNDLTASEDSLKRFREQNRKVIDSPELLLLQARLVREVTINTALYTELKKQYEIIRIDEIKSIPILNLLDPPRPPGQRSWPRRTLIVLIVTFLAGVLSVAYTLVAELYWGMVQSYVRAFDVTSEKMILERFLRFIRVKKT